MAERAIGMKRTASGGGEKERQDSGSTKSDKDAEKKRDGFKKKKNIHHALNNVAFQVTERYMEAG